MKKLTFSQGRAYLNYCIINGIPNAVDIDGSVSVNFAVHRVQVVEHICKPYFTATVVIENFLNANETFLSPMADVILSFTAKRDDGKPSVTYTERFKILEHDSELIDIEAQGRTETTINLIGVESVKNDLTIVTKNIANVTGTVAVRPIHALISSAGSLKIPTESKGMIGLTERPHEIKDMHPISAIRNILLRSVFATYKSCAPVYFRNKPGYVIAPLQYLLERARTTNTFTEKPAEGAFFFENIASYENIFELRQFYPKNKHSHRGTTRAQSFDINQGLFFPPGSLSQKGIKSIANKSKVTVAGLNSFMSGIMGTTPGKTLFNMINKSHQKIEVTKDGPGQYNTAQDAFLYALGLSPRYAVVVPMQSGLYVTCGDRINVNYPINGVPEERKLFVYEVVHNLIMTTLPAKSLPGYKKERMPEQYSGKTELNCIYWEN